MPHILVTGATGYVGGRMVPRLLEAGHRVRVLARTPQKVAGLPWAAQVDVVAGDLLDPEALERALDGVDGAYYLVHAMGGEGDFAERDRRAATSFAGLAAAAGVQRVVYLGGLGSPTSRHLASRSEVADLLLAGGTPTTVLRAAVILGSGSASFEMLRHLTEKLPVMVTPSWVGTRVQPIAIRDVLRYLLGVLDLEDRADHDYDIGGPDVLTYDELMQTYARVAGLPRRLVLRVPFLTPWLSSHWVNLITPVPIGLARPLILSLTSEVVVRPGGEDVTAVVPGPTLPADEAIALALQRIRDLDVETSWREADLDTPAPAQPYPGDPEWAGGTLLRDVRQAEADASAADVFATIEAIGGERGWPSLGWAWAVRGLADRLVGGVGLRRGRRHPETLRVGDALDFWRVEEHRAGELLRLRAEMRLPGRAWLEWRVEPRGHGAVLHQRALFAPRGLLGRLYWWSLAPFHGPIFGTMVRVLAATAGTRHQ